MHIFLPFRFQHIFSPQAVSVERIKGENRAMFQFSFTSVTTVSHLTENLFQFCRFLCSFMSIKYLPLSKTSFVGCCKKVKWPQQIGLAFELQLLKFLLRHCYSEEQFLSTYFPGDFSINSPINDFCDQDNNNQKLPYILLCFRFQSFAITVLKRLEQTNLYAVNSSRSQPRSNLQVLLQPNSCLKLFNIAYNLST